MPAVVVHGAGDLRVEELAHHHAPGPGEVAVRVRFGGICGSDLHYLRHGAVGDFRLREPLILGHEVSGTVAAVGPGVTRVEPGQPVTVHPATPCGGCAECRSGRANVCRRARYLGSAAHFPHVQGGFRDVLVVGAHQIVPLPPGLPLAKAALAEPLAVALHAVRRAGDVRGRRVLVTGAGPIGCLVIAALRAAGAGEIIARDLVPEALAVATSAGADRTELVGASEDGGEVDAAIESSGAAAGLSETLRRTARGGRVVALGLLPPGEVPVPVNLVVTRELELVGTFRFDREIDDAVAQLAGGLPVGDIVTTTLPLARAGEAFALAGDRTRASKVLLELDPGVTP
jgi:L-idonate 5-dehydrogenase